MSPLYCRSALIQRSTHHSTRRPRSARRHTTPSPLPSGPRRRTNYLGRASSFRMSRFSLRELWKVLCLSFRSLQCTELYALGLSADATDEMLQGLEQFLKDLPTSTELTTNEQGICPSELPSNPQASTGINSLPQLPAIRRRIADTDGSLT